MKKVGLLWKFETMGLYANSSINDLYAAVGQNTGNIAYVHAIRNSIRESHQALCVGYATRKF